MQFFGKTLVDSKQLANMQEIQKQYDLVQKDFTKTIIRPNLDALYIASESGAKVPVYPFALPTIYDLSLNVDALTIVLSAVRREIFRNGMEVVEEWVYKCEDCGKEFQSKPIEEEGDDLVCDTCGGHNLVRPKPEDRKFLQKLITDPVNNNGQSLYDVYFLLENDLDVADIGYVVYLKTYDIDNTTRNIVGSSLQEIITVKSTMINLVADRRGRIGYNDAGKKLYVCPIHRQKEQLTQRCNESGCDTECLPMVAIASNYYGQVNAGEEIIHYGAGEVHWGSKYQPSLLYGYSPIYAVWMKVMALYHMDEYVLKYYDKMRPPKGLLIVNSRNFESMKKAWDNLLKAAKEDPYMIYPLMVDTDKSGKATAQWIDFMQSLQDMQFTDVRNEFRRTIGAVFGVLPLFSGDLPTGWGNEGLQVTVTNRAIEWGQFILYTKFFKPFCRMLGIEGWVIRLKPNEEADELRDLQIEMQRIQNAVAMKGMGFDIEMDHTGKFKFSKKPVLDVPDKQGYDAVKPEVRGDRIQQFEGQPQQKRPSDEGGMFSGHPASGHGTSLSHKAEFELGWFGEIMKDMSDISTSDILKVAIKDLRQDAVSSAWIGNYQGYSQVMSKMIRSYLQMGFASNLSKTDMTKSLMTNLNMDLEQADKIVKTEYNHMLNRARELAYRKDDPEGKAKYRWKVNGSNPCPACIALASKTKRGVPIEKLKDLLIDMSLLHGHQGNRDWVLHPMDKCVVERVEVKKTAYKIKHNDKVLSEVEKSEQ